MSDTPMIVCEGCGKEYRWKEELAGKKVRCKCGHVMRIPEQPPSDPSDDSVGAIELADPSHDAPAPPPPKPKSPTPKIAPEPKVEAFEPIEVTEPAAPAGDACPSCGATLPPNAVLCIQCGYNLTTGQKLGTVGGPAAVATDDDDDQPADGGPPGDGGRIWQLKQWKIPLALLVFGLVMNFVAVMTESAAAGESADPGSTIMGMLTGTAIGVVLMVIAAFIAARLLDTTFGDMRTAVLKLAAIYVAPTAIAGMLASLTNGGFIVHIVVLLGAYFGLLVWLFDFDLFEAIIFAVIGWVIDYWIVSFILLMVYAHQ